MRNNAELMDLAECYGALMMESKLMGDVLQQLCRSGSDREKVFENLLNLTYSCERTVHRLKEIVNDSGVVRYYRYDEDLGAGGD